MSVAPELWRRARPILDAALELPPEARPAYVARACGEDAELREAVERLLAAAADERPFLEGLSARSLELLAAPPPVDAAGARIGPYRLIRLLGAGGMGAVYLAERDDGQFEQEVAIKLLRLGPISEEAVARFRRERQILAWLDHPGIARLLDGGVAEAGPYLVMEYVRGEPIDTWCDARGLGVEERVRLFLGVCEAVEFAHKNLVVHRDLKPGNVLVTAGGDVKLLDFGIARILDPERVEGPVTGTGSPFLTREYASPEQIRGGPITTAADVYGLGAVLYQLLTGRVPHDLAGLSPAAIEREVCETAPTRPSALRRELRGDLDTILLQALHPDPDRRYGSAAALADDLRRHLARRPVAARPDTVPYRLSRFVRRHAMGVAAAVLLALTLTAGAVATTYQRMRAERRAESVRELANALLFDMHDAVRDLPGSTAARQLLVSKALTYLDRLRAEAPSDPGLMLELAAAYERIGEIQGDPHRTNLGDLEGALSSYRQALALREAVWRRDSTDPAVRHALGNSYGRLAVVTSWSGRNDEAIRLSRRAIDLLHPLGEAVAEDRGRIESELGWWLIWAVRFDDGMAHLDRGVALLEPRARPAAAEPRAALDLWRAYSYQVDGYRFTDRHARALELLEAKALPLLRAVAERHPRHPELQYDLHVTHDYVGEMRLALGDADRAVAAYEEALRIARAMVDADSLNQKAFEALARSNVSLAVAFERAGDFDRAVEALEEGSRIHTRLFDRNPGNAEMANLLGNTNRRLCRVLREDGRPAEALPWCLAGERALEAAVAASVENTVVRSNLGSAYVLTARVYRALAEGAERGEAGRHRALARSRYAEALRFLHAPEGDDEAPEFFPDSVAAELASLPPGD